MLKKITIASILLLSSVACGSLQFQTGRPFNKEHIQAIRKGSSTKSDVQAIFGAPQTTGKDDDGNDTWGYLHISVKIPLRGEIKDQNIQRLTITFSGNTVKSYTYELSGE